MAELLQGFVPCADEVWRLHHLDQADCKFFQGFCDELGRLNGSGNTDTRQGTYCVTPSGRLLGRANHRDPARIAELLQTSLTKWEAMSREERLRTDDPVEIGKSIDREESKYPVDGLVLRVDSRDLPRHGSAELRDEDWRRHAYNFDHAWFSRRELDRTLPETIEVGARFALPPELVRRFTRLHLIDNVRGQANQYGSDQVRTARLEFEVVSIEDGVAKLELSGDVLQVDEERGIGIEGEFFGAAHLDLATRTFTLFDLLVVAERWGTSRYNQRHDDVDRAPIGFAVHLVPDHPTERVAPTGFWEYRWR